MIEVGVVGVGVNCQTSKKSHLRLSDELSNTEISSPHASLIGNEISLIQKLV
jgi:hypothetical protein